MTFHFKLPKMDQLTSSPEHMLGEEKAKFPFLNFLSRDSKREASPLFDALLKPMPAWRKDLDDITDWTRWLAEPDAEQALLILRRNAMMGLPCGSEKFLRKIEKQAGRSLSFKPQGRPKMKKDVKELQ